jgi:hypothetical protein
MPVLDWLDQNKSWVFSGIGVTILITLAMGGKVLWRTMRRSVTAPPPTPQQSSVPVPPFDEAKFRTRPLPTPQQSSVAVPPFDETKFRTRPLPTEIVAKILEAPLLHQENRRREFLGLRVQWRTTLSDATFVPGDSIQVELQDRQKHGYACIMAGVPMGLYPDLRLAKSGTEVWIAGTIVRFIGNFRMVLDDVELRITV